MTAQSALASYVREILPQLIEIRHDVHAHPELAYEEKRTAALIAAKLRELPGISIREHVGGTGIVATLGAEKTGRCIALRADMDALPIEEKTGKPYASRHPGKMHACGHDGHITCLLGAAMALSYIRDHIPYPIKFIFQPAEEGGAGAEKMCKDDALGNPPVAEIFGLHGNPGLELGQIGTRTDAFMGTSIRFGITITESDPIAVAAQMVVALQTIVSRNTDPLEHVVVTIGMMNGGSSARSAADSVHIRGTIRALNTELRDDTMRHVHRIATETAAAFGARTTIEHQLGYPLLVNSAVQTETVYRVADALLGADRVLREMEPVLGTEDFAYYLQHVPGNFWYLGLRSTEQAEMACLHSPHFDFSDAAIATGVLMHCEIALREIGLLPTPALQGTP